MELNELAQYDMVLLTDDSHALITYINYEVQTMALAPIDNDGNTTGDPVSEPVDSALDKIVSKL